MRKRNHKYELRRKVEVEYDLFESEALRSLSGKALWVLLRFMQKRRWHTSKYSGHKHRVWEDDNLTFPYSEALHFGISRSSFKQIIGELVTKGFIQIGHQGGWTGKDPSSYKLTDQWRGWRKTE